MCCRRPATTSWLCTAAALSVQRQEVKELNYLGLLFTNSVAEDFETRDHNPQYMKKIDFFFSAHQFNLWKQIINTHPFHLLHKK